MQDNTLPVLSSTENFTPVTMTPDEQVQKASEMAKVLQKVVKQADLARSFGGKKKHLEFEAWQTIGQFFNSTPITEWTKPICENDKIIGWESRVVVKNGEGRTIAAAESMCMRDEPNWKTKPNYALRSMSQTRAGGKALRSVFAFVAVLAGYSATPSEEMSSDFNNETINQKPPAKAWATKKQKEYLHGLLKAKNLSKPEEAELVNWFAPDGLTPGAASELIEKIKDDWDNLLDSFLAEKQHDCELPQEPSWE